MIFGYFTLLVALTISAVAAYYSIAGLTAIFAAAVIPIIIMGASLEVGKITAAVWLKLHWSRSKLTYKLYLVPAVTFLMVLTSMGIFGFLSKAHLDQTVPTGDIVAQVQIIDDKIQTQKDNIETARRALKQMDESVDQLMSRSTTEQGASRSAQLRRTQQKERLQLQADIAQAQKQIAKYQEERAPLASQARKVEAEVGPIKYVAALIYGDNPDANLLERSVRWVIILIVLVFDPLALVLILAAQQSIKWAKEDKIAKNQAAEEFAPEYEPVDLPKEDIDFADAVSGPVLRTNPESGEIELVPFEDKIKEEDGDSDKQLSLQFDAELPAPPVEVPVPPEPVTAEPEVAQPEPVIPDPPAAEPAPAKIPEARAGRKVPMAPVPETINVNKHAPAEAAINVPGNLELNNLGLKSDNSDLPELPKSGFGVEFPQSPPKGQMFLRVDQLPNVLYKFNGSDWIKVDKSFTDSYTYDEQYVAFLIEKLVSGEYEIDQLSAKEQELVTQKLKEIANEKT